MEVSKVEQDEEIELSLELSIGGIFRNFEKSKQQQEQIQQKWSSSSITFDVESCEINADLRRENKIQPWICLCISPSVSPIGGGGADALDPNQQLMKREIHALRRQEAHKKREAKRKWRNNCILKKEDEGSERFCKKTKSDDGNQTLNLNNPLPAFTSPPCPIIPTHFVPFANRFAFPHHMMSYCAVRTSSSSSYSSSPSSPDMGDSGKNESKCSGINRVQLHSSNSTGSSSDSSHTTESTQVIKEATSDAGKIVSTSNTQSSPRQIKQEPTNSVNINKTTSITKKNPVPRPPRTQSFVRCNKQLLKPQQQSCQIPCVCVRTTGNGPNGKTINGFLYRYSKTELSIMCVCHGNSFTPAEFVKHAGGANVSHCHPLKHILVVPSA